MTNTARCFSLRRQVLCCAAIGAVLSGLSSRPSEATLFTLTDDNSIARFDTASQANAFSWEVDGVNQLNQQAFWYRIGNAAEQSLDTLPIAVELATDTNADVNGFVDNLFVRYTGAGFRIEVGYRLDGGSAGSRASHMTEQISITNTNGGGPALDFHFFQYSDFNLAGTAGNDGALFTNANAVRQFDGITSMTETVVTPVPDHREINFFPATRNKLNDGLPTTLNDAPPFGLPLGPGDMTWAYQWDFSIAPGSTVQISKGKQLTGIPEPSSVLLAGLAACGLASMRRRRRAN